MPKWKDSQGHFLSVILNSELSDYQKSKFFKETGGFSSCPLVDELYRRISKLSPKLRKALILSCYSDNSRKQVAKTLGISVDTLKKRLVRAKKGLKR